jgi:hypothetical protein
MKINSIILLLFIATTGFSQANLGLGASFIPEIPNFGLQVRGAYTMSEKFALSGGYTYFFKKNNNLNIDLDAQFKLFNISDFRVSPFAGINIRKVESKTATGLQLGFFIEIPKNSYHIYLEPKAILDDNSVIAIAGGFYF